MRRTLAAKPFTDPNWFLSASRTAGERCALIRDGKEHLVSRPRNSLNKRFPELLDIAEGIKAKTAILDVEIVALVFPLTRIGGKSIKVLVERSRTSTPILPRY